jgi:hypothetical protein
VANERSAPAVSESGRQTHLNLLQKVVGCIANGSECIGLFRPKLDGPAGARVVFWFDLLAETLGDAGEDLDGLAIGSAHAVVRTYQSALRSSRASTMK